MSFRPSAPQPPGSGPPRARGPWASPAAAQWGLLKRLLWKEIAGRYRGSFAGAAWALLAPLAMLAVYTAVFGGIFKARWDAGREGGMLDFALALFAGLIVFNFFAEVATRAPSVVTAQPNYVRKVVFPLALLPVAAGGAALFQALASLAVLVAALALLGRLSWWALALPLVWLPLVAIVLGLAWFLAALGVYVRDVGQAIGPAVTALLFLSPVFYPASALPEALRPWLFLNPLAVPIEATRALLTGARAPDWTALALFALAAAAAAALGRAWFERTRKGFADVL